MSWLALSPVTTFSSTRLAGPSLKMSGCTFYLPSLHCTTLLSTDEWKTRMPVGEKGRPRSKRVSHHKFQNEKKKLHKLRYLK
ncbi:hypothetical protein BDA96_10G269600 [Sorghum bicolor]|uniref:Uncharacterized protein n=1 Tax=Sorghum bicolor TaxID=4558 RepID=A0A921Q4E9_SORBI|nr:hypothetical protein BDA96_10G269600 [Sorghum bicolor]